MAEVNWLFERYLPTRVKQRKIVEVNLAVERELR